MKKSSWGKWGVTVVLIGCAAWGAWRWAKPGTKPVEYRTGPVERGELTQAVTASGTINPVHNVQVGSQISGIIQKLHADFNSPVKAGQVIAQLDPSTYNATVLQNEADLASANAALELSRINAERAKALHESLLISKSDYDTAMANLRQAEAAVKQREAVLERTKVDLARCTIYAPIDGVVISRNVDVGQTVAASLSAPTLFVIANDLTKMQINAMVSEADVGGIEVGQSVNFTVDAFPGRNFEGRVVQVRNAPTTVQNVVTYDTVIEVENPDLKLKPGMTANVSIIVAKRENALKIANAALRFRPPDNAVLLPADTNAVPASAAADATAGGDAGLREDMLKRFDRNGDGQLDESEREAMRSQMRSGGGRSGGRTGGGRRPGAESQPIRTVYLATTNGTGVALKPVQVKTGISDGVTTEVLEGVNEGDTLVVGVKTAETAAPQRPAANPFGGSSPSPRRF